MIYFPIKRVDQNPGDIGLKYEDVFLKTADGKTIHGWLIENKDSNKIILYFHGNGGNIGHRLPIIEMLYPLPVNIFMIDYHGYGKSEGRASEQNLYLDAQAAYDYLIREKKYLPAHIILMGSSMGGAVALDLAVREKVGGVILKSTFTSAKDMAKDMLFFFRWPMVWVRSDFNSLEKIDSIKAPVLIIHSKEDEMIPYQMSLTLYEKAVEPKKLLLLEKGRHNDLIVTPEYIEGLRQMVK